MPSTLFRRVHRSFLVNRSRITSISRREIIIEGITIPVGENYQVAIDNILLWNQLAIVTVAIACALIVGDDLSIAAVATSSETDTIVRLRTQKLPKNALNRLLWGVANIRPRTDLTSYLLARPPCRIDQVTGPVLLAVELFFVSCLGVGCCGSMSVSYTL